MPTAKYESIPVRVQLLRGKRVVAEQTVTGSHTFRFAVAAGDYVVRSNQSATVPTHSTVTPASTTTVNIYSACM